MNGNVDRLLEAIRQRALVRSGRLFGQVECEHDHGPWIEAIPCWCGAIV
jgi:hypothetical protein